MARDLIILFRYALNLSITVSLISHILNNTNNHHSHSLAGSHWMYSLMWEPIFLRVPLYRLSLIRLPCCHAQLASIEEFR